MAYSVQADAGLLQAGCSSTIVLLLHGSALLETTCCSCMPVQCLVHADIASFALRCMIAMQTSPQVSSNVDRGPLARKRDVAFIYHTNKMNDLQKQVSCPMTP